MRGGRATAVAHPNIALVKYWGKRDADLNLPAAPSLSVTLQGMSTTTTVAFGAADRDVLLVDGEPAPQRTLRRAVRVLDELRAEAGSSQRAVVESRNDFPAGAGLASSASGMAALAVAAAAALGLELAPHRLSAVARLGSGSACRSLFGGFVLWQAGERPDGSDSHGVPLHPPGHWDLRVLVAVVDERPKPVGSTRGMLHAAATSPYHEAFVRQCEADVRQARLALARRDFAALARVAERSCLRMHADCMAADPPLLYMTADSWRVVELARALREKGAAVLFTVDAGPNVKLFCEPASEEAVARGLAGLGCVRRVIRARPGPGARLVG